MAVQETLKFWESVLQDKNAQDRRCPKCGTEVYHSVLRLRGRNWHRECFQCMNCAKTLNLATYTEVNHEIFCSACYADCFSRQWRCSELIDSKRLSKQLRNVVMEGQHFRWLQSKASSDSDSSNGETTPPESAVPEAPELPSDPPREPEEPAASRFPVDEAVNDLSEDEPLRQRAQTVSSVERPVCARLDNPRIPAAHRPIRQISRGRLVASEGVPERRFEPNVLLLNRTRTAPNEEAKADQTRLRGIRGQVHTAAVQTDDAGVNRRAWEERRYSNIYAIRESPEDSEDADPSQSQSDSSSSVEFPPTPPPKPFRLRRLSASSANTALDAVGVQEPSLSSARPTTRSIGGPRIRRTRFPSDNLADLQVTSSHDLRP